MGKRPKIAVTGPDRGGKAAWIFSAISVWIAGGVPVRIRPSKPRNLKGLNGIIIGGGADIDPEAFEVESFLTRYLKETIQDTRQPVLTRVRRFFRFIYYPFIFLIRKLFSRKGHKTDPERDKLELHLLDQAYTAQLPVLGICRGAQLINIYFKGTLHQEIEPFYEEKPNRASVFPVKTVFLKSGSRLASILGLNKIKVNALHHQAVEHAGKGLQIVAWETNQVVQAIESTTSRFILGVQWHPEYLLQKPAHRRIFSALITAAKGKSPNLM